MSTIPLLGAPGLRHAVRGLWRRPGFTAAAALTLALGIGATTAIFSVVYGVLIKPLSYPDADELVSIGHTAPGLTADVLGSAETMYLTYREENRVFEHLGLWSANELTLTGLGEPERIAALAVTDGALQALGVQPVLGRWLSDAEYLPGATEGPDPVILSHAFWQRRFGGDVSALGRAISLNSRPAQVVGVMPPGFRFLNLTPQPDVIGAIRMDSTRLERWESGHAIGLGHLNYRGLARLNDDVTLAEANSDVARMLPIWLETWPASPRLPREAVADWRVTPALRPLKDDVIGSVAGMLWLLMGAVGAVLLIACANIANLLLVRADARRHELAIRSALGASRRRIAGELLRESVLLGAIGAVVGVGLADAGIKLLAAIAPPNLPRVEDITVGLPVLAFAVAAALVSSLAFGSIPAAKQLFGSDGRLDTGARGASASPQRNRTRNALIVLQVALALVLLVGAGQMIRTVQALTAVDAGFTDPEKIQFARIFVPYSVMQEPERYLRTFRDVLDRIAALPGVTAASFGGPPLGGSFRGPSSTISVEGRPVAAGASPATIRSMGISPGYFEALGTRLVAGRSFTWADSEQGGTLVSENLARELWGEPQAAIGKRIRSELQDDPGPWREIIGVTQNVHLDGLHEEPPPLVFGLVKQGPADLRVADYVIRSDRAGTESLVKEVRQAVWQSHPDLAVFGVRTMQDIYEEALARTSFILVLLAIAGAMALLLSVVGMFGVISYIVSQRSREIGIRLALGAEPPAVKRRFVLHGLGVAAIGIAAGLAAAAAFSRFLASLLFEVRPLDPATYLAVVGVLLAAVSVAAYLPARRAARLDPAETLRAE